MARPDFSLPNQTRRFWNRCRSVWRWSVRRRLSSVHSMFVLVLTASIAWTGLRLVASPWPATVTISHWLAAPNCAAARAVGLAPAYRGEPGYYIRHDRDLDGIACEPWPPVGHRNQARSADLPNVSYPWHRASHRE